MSLNDILTLEQIILPLAIGAGGVLIWLIRLEGRVNNQGKQIEQVDTRVDMRLRRIDEKLDSMARDLNRLIGETKR